MNILRISKYTPKKWGKKKKETKSGLQFHWDGQPFRMRPSRKISRRDHVGGLMSFLYIILMGIERNRKIKNNTDLRGLCLHPQEQATNVFTI